MSETLTYHFENGSNDPGAIRLNQITVTDLKDPKQWIANTDLANCLVFSGQHGSDFLGRLTSEAFSALSSGMNVCKGGAYPNYVFLNVDNFVAGSKPDRDTISAIQYYYELSIKQFMKRSAVSSGISPLLGFNRSIIFHHWSTIQKVFGIEALKSWLQIVFIPTELILVEQNEQIISLDLAQGARLHDSNLSP